VGAEQGFSTWIRGGALLQGKGTVSGGSCPTPASLSAPPWALQSVIPPRSPRHPQPGLSPRRHAHPLTEGWGGFGGGWGKSSTQKATRAALKILPPRKPCSNRNCNSTASRAGSGAGGGWRGSAPSAPAAAPAGGHGGARGKTVLEKSSLASPARHRSSAPHHR